MEARKILFSTKNIYDSDRTEPMFIRAVRENCRFHSAHSVEYRAILRQFHFSPESIRTERDLAGIPVLPTLLFKRRRLFSMPERRILLRAASSGTGGAASLIGFSAGDLYCGLRMVLGMGRCHQLFSARPAHYILFGYQPNRKNETAAVRTAYGATFFTPALSRSYALKYRDGCYQVEIDGLIRAIQKCGDSRFPTRLIGFPSYAYFTLREMERRGMSVRLKKGSKILLGGGWKQFVSEEVTKDRLYELAKHVLGIGKADVIEFFSAVEHPILYCSCKNHHFHIPVWSRILIRDPDTLEPLGYDEEGLVNLISPMMKATPLLSVMTDDLGILRRGCTCGCGIQSPYLELKGRVGMRAIKTCAAGAADILEGRMT